MSMGFVMKKRDMVFTYLTRKKVDIAFLQETHSINSDEKLWTKEWGGSCFFSHGSRNSRGVAILTSYKSGIQLTKPQRDVDGRWVKGDIAVDDKVISLISIYGPNSVVDRKPFFTKLQQFIFENDFDDCVVAGDFNCQVSNSRDPSSKILQNIIEDNGFLDVGETLDNTCPTLYHKGLNKTSRIDYFFVSETVMTQVKEFSVNTTGLSDHRIITMRLGKRTMQLGPGRWFCDNAVFRDKECKTRIKNFWRYWKSRKNGYIDILDWWDIGKSRLKEILKDYSSHKNYREKKEKSDLQKNLDILLNSQATVDKTKYLELERLIKAHEYREWEKTKMQLHIKQKVKGEKPSKYFFSAVKQQQKE